MLANSLQAGYPTFRHSLKHFSTFLWVSLWTSIRSDRWTGWPARGYSHCTNLVQKGIQRKNNKCRHNGGAIALVKKAANGCRGVYLGLAPYALF
jgi:hypothetical protein